MNTIRKRDGRKVPFDSARITQAIVKAAKEVANEEGVAVQVEIAEKLTENIVQHLNEKFKKKLPSVEDIQEEVIHELIEEGHARTAEKYITYRNERSRLRERQSRLMKNIGEITFADSNESDLKRDNANVDGNTPMGMMLQYGSAVSKEFCFNEMINPTAAALHENGDIHIHDADFINMGTLTCCQIDLEKLFKNGFNTGHGFIREPQSISTYSALAAIAIQSNQNDQHGGQSIPAFDYYMAPGIRKTFIHSFYENLEKVIEIHGISIDKREMKAFEQTHNYRDRLHPEMVLNHEFETILRGTLVLNLEVPETLIDEILDFTQKYALAETQRQTYQAMEGLIHNLNTMHSRAGAQVPFSSLNFGTDTSPEGRLVSENLLLAQEAGLGNGETPIFPILIFKVKEGINYNPKDPNYDLFKLSCRVSAKRLFPNFSFLDAPFNKQYYVPGQPDTEIAYMGCRTRVAANHCGDEVVTGRGNCSFTSINLPRIGIKHGVVTLGRFDEAGFFAELDSKLDTVFAQLLERMQIQGHRKVKNFPFLMGQGIWRGSENLGPEDTLEEVVKQGTLTIGFIGLAECLKAAIGVHHGESEEAQKLGLQIIGWMRKRVDEAKKKTGLNFSLIATPAEGLSGRFTRMDKKRYGIIEGVTDRDYYTNSFHVPVYYAINAFDKIQKEAPYHELTNGGHISYIEMDGDPCRNLEAFEGIIRAMKEQGIGYGSINHPVDRDPVCGYSGVIEGDVCPKCGRRLNERESKHYKVPRMHVAV